jgi:hypothetical protein
MQAVTVSTQPGVFTPGFNEHSMVNVDIPGGYLAGIVVV